jgi:prolyl oligopeptidase
VQNPDLAVAVVSHVGTYDMVRVELDPNGTFNIPEFGTVKDKDQFAALYAYSPYHNVEDGQAYPPILLPTGANNSRAKPGSLVRARQAELGDCYQLMRLNASR